MNTFAIKNRFGYYPCEWDKFSILQKLRMHFDACRLIRGDHCHFIKGRAEIWRGRVPIGANEYRCGKPDEQGFSCWCECGNGVLRQGKYNCKGEKVMKYEYRFLHH